MNKTSLKNKKVAVLVFFFVLLGIAFIIYYFLSLQKPLITYNKSHKVSFDVISCFSCYGCGCRYTVDSKDIYDLNEFDKTMCIYNLDGGDVGKYHDFISEASRVANEAGEKTTEIILEKDEFAKFIDCVIKYSK